jgi:hypothetical protein
MPLKIVEGLWAPVERCALARRRLAHESNERIARHDSRRSDRKKVGYHRREGGGAVSLAIRCRRFRGLLIDKVRVK